MDKKVKEHYNKLHDSYLQFYGDTIQAHRPENVDELLSYLNHHIEFNENDLVLDAGCGVCGAAVYFAGHNNIKIEAITISEKQFDHAKLQIAHKNLDDKIKLKLGDFHLMDNYYPPETFDKIIFLESFGHSQNKPKLLNVAFKLLKYDGFIYIKDYFATEITGSPERKKLMKTAIKNMKKLYCYDLANLDGTIKELRKLGMTVEFINKPQFELSNEHVVNSFEKENKIDLFGSDYMPVVVEPLELKFKKAHKD